jgi:folate-dependent phosphoribosylglycinamide formyltransferase PurN
LFYNGHPGLITKYPELKGKDPQVRAFEGKYPVAGAVIHKVTAGVDEGRIIMEEYFNATQLDLDGLFRILRDRSLYMWSNLLKQVL